MTLDYFLGDGVEAFSALRDEALPYRVVQAHQVHSDTIAFVESEALTRQNLEGYDALVTNVPGVAIGARTADCVPVLLYDPTHKAVAAVHSGWKGTVLRIGLKTLEFMRNHFETDPADVRAVIGPSIGPDSFQVGPEVAQRFEEAGFNMDNILTNRGERIAGSMQGGLHIDLWKANLETLVRAGVLEDNIQISSIDTYTDLRFYSARREGSACGRTINAIRILRE